MSKVHRTVIERSNKKTSTVSTEAVEAELRRFEQFWGALRINLSALFREL